jgi:cytochrome c oxidase subunit 4
METSGSTVSPQPIAAAAMGEQSVEWGGEPSGGGDIPHSPAGHAARSRESGSQLHLFAFIASVLLTLLAFGAALYGEMSVDLLAPFLMLMAAIQLVIQLVYWMRLKHDDGFYSILSLAFGSIITLAAVGAAVYWVWI